MTLAAGSYNSCLNMYKSVFQKSVLCIYVGKKLKRLSYKLRQGRMLNQVTTMWLVIIIFIFLFSFNALVLLLSSWLVTIINFFFEMFRRSIASYRELKESKKRLSQLERIYKEMLIKEEEHVCSDVVLVFTWNLYNA